MAIEISGTIAQFGNITAAVGALGTAAFGLVDASKAFQGGVSNAGFTFIRKALAGFEPALGLVDPNDPIAIIRANWLNGVDKATQKATVKSIIRLGLTSGTVADLARAVPSIDAAALAAATARIEAGAALSSEDVDVLGRFDAIVDARLDTGFERADQRYRNWAKVAAAIVALILSFVGMRVIDGSWGEVFGTHDLVIAFIVGLIATPLAPVAKDITTAIGTAAAALAKVKG